MVCDWWAAVGFPPATKKITLLDQTGKWAQLWLRERTRKSAETKQREGCPRPDHRALSKPRGNDLNGSGGRGFQLRAVWGPAGKAARKVTPFRAPGWAPRAPGREQTGTPLAPAETLPPRAGRKPRSLHSATLTGTSSGPPGLRPGSGSSGAPQRRLTGGGGGTAGDKAPAGTASPAGLGRPLRPHSREGNWNAALETVSNRPPGPYPSPTTWTSAAVYQHPAPAPPGDSPPPGPSARPPAYLAGGQGRAGQGGGQRWPGARWTWPGARCRWWRRRLRLLSLQLPLSPAPPSPPPPAFPRALRCGQERPNQSSAPFGVSQVSSSLRRR